jgi:regulator of sirC expression with transglutaminase-like and TPR domain
MDPKPELPEAARRLRVQAESAVNAKRFADAADKYAEALALAPWWPEGHFNRGVVLGEMQQFDSAANEMKRYLMLRPDAPDARQAQDFIYAWEDYPYENK